MAFGGTTRARSVDVLRWLSRIPFAYILVAILFVQAAAVMFASQAVDDTGLYHVSRYPDEYGDAAANIAAGKGYVFCDGCSASTFREPGYILFLAGIFKLFGENPMPGRMANIALIFAAAFLVYRICSELSMAELPRRIAAVSVLVFPYTAFSVLRLSPELLFMALLLAFLYFCIRGVRDGRSRDFLLSGLFFGLAALTRSTLIPFLAVLGVYLVSFSGMGRMQAVKGLAALVVAFLAVYSPWPVRNYVVTGSLVPTATVFGDALYQGMYVSKHDGDGRSYKELLTGASREQEQILARNDVASTTDGFFQHHFVAADEVRHNRILVGETLKAYLNDPALYLKSVVRQAWSFWVKGREGISTAINAAVMIPVLALAILGYLRHRRGLAPEVSLIVLMVLCYYGLHVATLAHARHSVPILPYVMMFAALPLCGWLAIESSAEARIVPLPMREEAEDGVSLPRRKKRAG